MLLHLGMSGRMVLTPVRPNLPTLHEHLVLETDDGWRLGFVDPRRFGSVDLVPTRQEDAHRLLADLGPEPLDPTFTPARLSASLAGKRTPIKAALLDQKVVAGLGNIYVCEALFRARISPLRSAHTIPGTRAAGWCRRSRTRCARRSPPAVPRLRDYVQPDGELGYFQHAWKVYGREGEACERCPGRPACPGIRRITQSARSTFYCPRTQR